MRIDVEIGSNEWKEMRKRFITATDAAAILGVSPWSNPRKLYESKKGMVEEYSNMAMDRGNFLEQEARVAFESIVDTKVHPEFHVSDLDPWAAATFDGINEDGVLVEIKCPGIKAHEDLERKGIPNHYMAQCQHQLFVSGLESMYFFSYHPEHKNPMILLNVKRDNRFIENMVEAERSFYESLQEDNPPVMATIPQDIEAEFVRVEKLLADCLVLEESLSEQIESHKSYLKQLCGDRAVEGSLLKVTPYQIAGKINYKRIPELQGVDLELYRGDASQAYRFTLKRDL